MLHRIIIVLFSIFAITSAKASHVMGGDLTWTCQGGDYVFQLVFYRDCNGAIGSTSAVTVDVWGHPTITSINLSFVSNTDVSPFCTPVAGGPGELICGIGANSGNGAGAIEKFIYQSAPITLTGVPPASGWVFTYQNFSRSASLTNINSPSTYGISIISKMFALPNSAGLCIDNSPQFLQEPYFVSCAGSPYEYNMNAVDPDLDSLHVSFGIPLNNFPSQIYQEGVIPTPIAFEPGFSYSSPTPDASMNAANIAAQIDPVTGNLTFLSNTIGNYNVKIIAQSFRNGVLIAEVSREMQLIVSGCNGSNNAPVINGPFGGLFETTISPGVLVNFNLASTDVELLQDGTPQDNILLATGPMFGANFTSNLGCAIAPCATLDATPLITMSQGVNTTFNWQTTCDHLVNPFGQIATSIPYHFVFKVQDNYCQIPKVSYATITINITNPGIVPAPVISCIQSNISNDVTLNWTAVNDPLGTFNSYQVHTVQNGLIATINDINTTSFIDLNVNSQNDYFLVSASACNGNTLTYSDTISNIFLDLTNPGNGIAFLQWNDPVSQALTTMNDYYHIYREYPAGTWTLIDSVLFGTNSYQDTITICDVFFNYQIVLPNQPCDYTSNIEGGNFQDAIAPNIPVISNVSIDSLTNEVTITWNQNYHPDTYGYIVYIQDASGAIVELDQTFNISDTSYTYSPDLSLGALTYSVAAYDSCIITTVPLVYQTSAKGELHTSIFLSTQLNLCSRSITINWSDYVGWNSIDHYELFVKSTSEGWSSLGDVSNLSYTFNGESGETYTFVLQGFSDDGRTSFSNTAESFIASPRQPTVNYLQVATVNDSMVELRHFIDLLANVQGLSIQRENDGVFEEIGQVAVPTATVSFIDKNVNVNEESYTYRVQVIDSCGLLSDLSNEAQTILLKIQCDDVRKLNYLSWSPYQEFNGSVLGYNLYRGIDTLFSGAPIVFNSSGELSYEDSVEDIISIGKICYYVEAVESMNIYNFSELSRSNIRCITLPPLIFIPNAFTPGGINPIFRPVLRDFNPANYDFTIFDRWGQVIFKTSLPEEGWDGTIDLSSRTAPTGTYIYMVTIHDGDGLEIIRRGHVTLLK